VRVEESIEIARLPEEVWDVVVDPRRDPEWCSKVKSVEPEGELRWRVVHKPVPLRPALELVVDQVDADPPRRLRLREEDKASVFDVEYRLEPSEAGTRGAHGGLSETAPPAWVGFVPVCGTKSTQSSRRRNAWIRLRAAQSSST
jgi:uncharacterized protein YndB with AHSA1/START domain